MAQHVIKQSKIMNIPYLKYKIILFPLYFRKGISGVSHTHPRIWGTAIPFCLCVCVCVCSDSHLVSSGPASASVWASRKGQIQVLLSSPSISLLVFLAVVPSEMSPLWRPPSILCINVNNELYNHNTAEDSLQRAFVTFFQCCNFTLKNSGMSWMFP